MTPSKQAEIDLDERIVGGYQTLLSEDLRLAHAALLAFANANNEDGWPHGRDVLRFARFYGCSPGALGGLVGLLCYRLGRRLVWVDTFRCPSQARSLGADKFAPHAMVAYGIYTAASALVMRHAETMH